MRTRFVALALLLPALSTAQPALPVQPTPETKESLQLPTVAPLVESVKGAVVNVDVVARGRGGGMDLSELFGGPPQQRESQGSGSGFIIDPKGIVLTNNHVVESAIRIRVNLNDGRSYEGDVLGRDPLTDVAVVKLLGVKADLPFVKLGDSDAVRVGDWVLAIGNPFGLASSVSVGILSARARQRIVGPYDDFLQTDAAINPGNSGGPLFNMKGEVVGINTAIVRQASGIGFAIPSNLARALLPQLTASGSVTRAWLGIGIQDLDADLAGALGVPQNEGAIVTEVNEGSPAGKAGLKADDVVTQVEGAKITSGGHLSRTVALMRPGSVATLTVFRGKSSKPVEVKVTLGTRPDVEGLAKRNRARPEEAPEKKGARIGVAITDLDPRVANQFGIPPQGALVTEVVPGSAADRAKLQPGMIVVEVNEKKVKTRVDLWQELQKAKPGAVLLLRVREPPTMARGLRALNVP